MKTLKVLGTGCAKCQQLTHAVEAAADELGIEYQLEKVTSIDDIVAHGVMATPALVVDGVVKVSGKVPTPQELRGLLA